MKKVVSLLLVLVLALGMSTVVFAAPVNNVLVVGFGGSSSTGTTWLFDIDMVLQKDGNEIIFPISEFDSLTATAAIPGGGVATGVPTYKQVKAEKTTIKASVKSGSKAWDSVSIVKDNYLIRDGAAVKVVLKDPFVSTSDIDVLATLTFYYDGTRSEDIIELDFNYSNNVVEVESDDDYADIADGSVLEGLAYIKLLDAEIGEGVHVWTKIFKDKKYYGIATRDDDERDDVIYAKYPDVDSVITIQSIGLSSTAQYVTFEDYDDTFWVYGNVDGAMKYLGKSDEKITTFCNKYYLANKELVIEGEEEEEPDDSDVPDAPEPDEGTGGDDAPANVNDNPGTGA